MTDYGHDLAFGTFITPQNADPHAPVRLAQLSEQAGLDLVTFQDHPYQPTFHDTWTLLSWVAARTERVTLSGNVLNLPLRQPAVLARAAASLDLLSGGRVALGIGAGAFWDAVAAMGGPRLTPGESVQALEEAMEIVRGIWDARERRPLRLDGEHHRVAGAKRGPAPAHDIPIWVGAYKPRMLRLVGRAADGWLPSLAYLKDGDLRRGNAIVDEAAQEAGRDPSEVRRLLNVGGAVLPSRQGFLQGPVEQWVDELTALAIEDGVGTFVLASDEPRLIEVFGEEIAPAVREQVARERSASGTVPAAARRGARALALRRPGIDYAAVPASLAATAVEPGDREYPAVRHNYLRAGAPGIVLRPRTTEQVVEALAYARAQDVPLGVRSGGHGISGRSTNDGGVVIDLGGLDRIEVVDGATRRVRLGAGATWGAVAEALRPHGWAISSGDYGGVGVGGLATTGGVGLLGRVFGLTIDHVVAAEVVTADGRVLHASADENPDLFWGLRGAGANLGIVTWVEVEAMPLGDVVYSRMTLDATDTAGLLERWGAAVERAPRELTSFLILSPGRRGDGPVAQLMTVHASDDTDAAVRELERLADAGPVLAHEAYLVPYTGVVQRVPKDHAGGGDPAVRSGLVEHLDPDTSRAFEKLAASGVPYFLQVRATGGAAHDVAPDATAYPHRHQNFVLTAMAVSQDRMDAVWDAEMAPHTDGLYLSFDTDTRPERLVDAFGEPGLARLRRLKREYDPQNVFRSNFPIPPADD
ncbi:LLM class flavin-dependent oxidoreductase [Isoptericola variabilis]|uniref:FAD linked oxidase domain protein n=1 Tax=Isoptericola variabilis (strain 225) TaxID=743718 RepID=F6FWL7_ISOV2|nr:LLM class flavin-dependent oxidoreductase [Isoptericola variabilis]AEG45658.1 FAD linked oxidase domain protein [Isoptericola variabilis 225]TWH28820.1 FAD/FMN-containing dehydrogenase [Isoptericola variabilis J7]